MLTNRCALQGADDTGAAAIMLIERDWYVEHAAQVLNQRVQWNSSLQEIKSGKVCLPPSNCLLFDAPLGACLRMYPRSTTTDCLLDLCG